MIKIKIKETTTLLRNETRKRNQYKTLIIHKYSSMPQTAGKRLRYGEEQYVNRNETKMKIEQFPLKLKTAHRQNVRHFRLWHIESSIFSEKLRIAAHFLFKPTVSVEFYVNAEFCEMLIFRIYSASQICSTRNH